MTQLSQAIARLEAWVTHQTDIAPSRNDVAFLILTVRLQSRAHAEQQATEASDAEVRQAMISAEGCEEIDADPFRLVRLRVSLSALGLAIVRSRT